MRISDWSSDVCSSDLKPSILTSLLEGVKAIRPGMTWGHQAVAATANIMFPFFRVTDRLLFQAIRRTPLGFLDARTMEDLKAGGRSEEHTSELQSLMRISYAVFCLKKKKTIKQQSSKR